MKKVQLALVATWLLFASLPCPAEEWAKTYGGSGDDSAHSVEQIVDSWGDPDGYVVAGENAGNIWVLRVGNTGTVLWEKTYGPGKASSVRKIPNGFLAAGGGWAMELDNTGALLWHKEFDLAGYWFYHLHAITPGRVAVGTIYPDYVCVPEVDCSDSTLLFLGADGTVTRQKLYDGDPAFGELAISVQPIVDLGGNPDGFVVLMESTTVVRITDSGEVSLSKRLSDWDVSGVAIWQTADRGYILTGATFSGAGATDVWVAKLDFDLSLAWQRAYGGTGADRARCIQQTLDGGYVVAGDTSSFGAGGFDIWVLKLDASGDIVWQRTFGGSGDEHAQSIQQTVDGGYIATGKTDSVSAGGNDCLILKLDANGQVPGCSLMGDSEAIVTDIAGLEEYTNVADWTINPWSTDAGVVPEDTHAVVTDFCDGSTPYISQKIKPRPCERGQIVRIVGYNFGDTQDDSVVHIGPTKVYGPGHTKIKLWTDTKIKIKVPNYPCSKWEGRDIYLRKVWVTVNGVNSNKKRIRILKPDACP